MSKEDDSVPSAYYHLTRLLAQQLRCVSLLRKMQVGALRDQELGIHRACRQTLRILLDFLANKYMYGRVLKFSSILTWCLACRERLGQLSPTSAFLVHLYLP